MTTVTTKSNIRVHFDSTMAHLYKFGVGCLKAPEVAINAFVSVILCFLAIEAFLRTDMSDITHFSDASFTSSTTDFSMYPVSVVAGVNLTSDTICSNGDRICVLGHPSELLAGTSGIVASAFSSFNQNEFSLPHLLVVAFWFTTPISLFLLANATWAVFEQWMWWGLYVVIFIWDVVGLCVLMFVNYSPLYNKVMVFVYFMYSILLMYSVRETWKLRYSPAKEGGDRGKMDRQCTTLRAPVAHGHSAIPAFMQKLVVGSVSNTAYTLTADAEDDGTETAEVVSNVPTGLLVVEDSGTRSALAPEVITHTFTRTVLLLTEFFFIAPVIYISAFVLVQERIMPVEVQVRYWHSTLMFGIVVLIEKSRKTRLSYVTDTVLYMAGLVSVVTVSWILYPELLRVFNGVPAEPGPAFLYCTFILCYLVAVINLTISIVFIMFIGKDTSKLIAFQEASPKGGITHSKTTLFTRVVDATYYLNAVSLCVVKTVLLVCFAANWLQNREW
jgi:hypothetical protein